MPRSKKPRHPYRGPQDARDLKALTLDSPAPATPAGSTASSAPKLRPVSRRLVPLTVGLGAVGAGGYAYHRSRQRSRQQELQKNWKDKLALRAHKWRLSGRSARDDLERGYQFGQQSRKNPRATLGKEPSDAALAGALVGRNRNILLGLGAGGVAYNSYLGSKAHRELREMKAGKRKMAKSYSPTMSGPGSRWARASAGGSHPPVALPVPRSRSVRALVPTGRHVADSANIEYKRRSRSTKPSNQILRVKKRQELFYGGVMLTPALQVSKTGWNIVKADRRGRKNAKAPSFERQTLGTVLPGFHGGFAGRKGRKLRAAGNEFGGGLVGGEVGAATGYILSGGRLGPAAAGRLVGAFAGSNMGTRRAHRLGHYKPDR